MNEKKNIKTNIIFNEATAIDDIDIAKNNINKDYKKYLAQKKELSKEYSAYSAVELIMCDIGDFIYKYKKTTLRAYDFSILVNIIKTFIKREKKDKITYTFCTDIDDYTNYNTIILTRVSLTEVNLEVISKEDGLTIQFNETYELTDSDDEE